MTDNSGEAGKRRIRNAFLLNGAMDLALGVLFFFFGKSMLGLEHDHALIVGVGLCMAAAVSCIVALTKFRAAPVPQAGPRRGKIVDRG